MSGPDEIARLDAVAQADLVRRGQLTPLELVDSAIARIESLDHKVNAVIQRRFEKARQEAASPDLPDGPFTGVPIVIKDLWCHTAGDPFHKGMRFLKELGWTEEHDTGLATKLRAAGFVFVGRTNVPELGLQPTTEPEAYGPTRNPWDLDRSVGGSSGGAAAAVAAGMTPVAQASDGGGSIRIPASECGLVGLKPSRGRVSPGPFVGELTNGLSIELAVTRSVRDTAAILDAVHGPIPGDVVIAPPPARPYVQEVGADPRRLRIGLLPDDPRGLVSVHPDCTAAAEETGKILESLGHTVELAHPAGLANPEILGSVATFFATNVAAGIEFWSRRTGKEIRAEDVEPGTWQMAEIGRALNAIQVIAAREQMLLNARRIAEWWAEGFDLLLSPTIPEPPPPLGTFATEEGLLRAASFVTFCGAFNTTGQPAISLPLGESDGLPVGVQLAAAYGREDVLLRVAAQLEEAHPWAARRPPIHA